jgi:hypothetical protein
VRNIGNLELEQSKFLSIREKLLSEMREELEKNKKLPSIIELVGRGKDEKLETPKIGQMEVKYSEPKTDKSKIESEFAKTYSTLFGRKPNGGIDDYSEWLIRHTRPTLERVSAMSGRKLILAPHAQYANLPKDRLLSSEEAEAFGKSVKLDASEVEALSMKNAHEKINKLAFFDIEMADGANDNIIDCAIYADSVNCYKSSVTVYTKNCAYSFWPRSCQYLFGCDSPFDSTFCINCYSCTQLSRCFEIDCCGYCSDLYFGHNCENVHQSMFCFNMKNRRNCIGNAEYSKEDYGRIRGSLLSQIADELEKSKDFKLDIYNIGSRIGSR